MAVILFLLAAVFVLAGMVAPLLTADRDARACIMWHK